MVAAIQPIRSTLLPSPQPPDSHLIGGYVSETLDLLNKHGIRGTDVQVSLIAEGTIQVTDGERLIRVSGLDHLGKQMLELLRKDQARNIELDKELTRLNQLGIVETSLGVFSTTVGIASAVATGGTAGVVIGTLAVLKGAYQIASRMDAFYNLAGKITANKEKQEEIGKALHTYLGYLTFAGALVNIAIGGTELAAKGFEEATKVSLQGISDVTSFGQGLAHITQTKLEGNRLELQIEGQKITIELTDINFEREEHNAGIRESNKAEELAYQAAMNEHRIKSETTRKIIAGR